MTLCSSTIDNPGLEKSGFSTTTFKVLHCLLEHGHENDHCASASNNGFKWASNGPLPYPTGEADSPNHLSGPDPSVSMRQQGLSLDMDMRAEVGEDNPVNHPPHYTAGSIECIDALQATAIGPNGFIEYCRLSAIKYIWRAPFKGNYKQDIEKAKWYVDRILKDWT